MPPGVGEALTMVIEITSTHVVHRHQDKQRVWITARPTTRLIPGCVLHIRAVLGDEAYARRARIELAHDIVLSGPRVQVEGPKHCVGSVVQAARLPIFDKIRHLFPQVEARTACPKIRVLSTIKEPCGSFMRRSFRS